MSTKYQPGIDALRAVAVLAVLLFHLDLPWAAGGFVGVDVFFVISGYLITQSIIDEGPRFSLWNFYRRRFMRLYPALIATIGMVLVAGYLLTDPATFKETARSSIWASLSASNFFFWLNQGYFDAAAQTQPLLHTWTLGAEWQFYLVWAPLIAFLPRRHIWVPALLVGSLFISQWLLSVDASASYFLMPTRMFELALGAVLAIRPVRVRKPDAAAVVGLAMILVAVVVYNAETPFPGAAALLPCIGAIAWIVGADGRLLRVASNPWMLYLGKISYSVYLVHWPIIVTAKYYWFGPLSASQASLALVASLVFGAALYHLVEKPLIRRRGFIPVTASIAATAMALSLAIIIDRSGGVPQRIPADYAAKYSDPAQFHAEHYGGNGYELETPLGVAGRAPDVVLFGDSFALQHVAAVDELLKRKNLVGVGIFAHGCYFSPTHTRFINGAALQGCHEAYTRGMAKIKGTSAAVILGQHWAGYYTVVATLDGKKISFRDPSEFHSLLIQDLTKLRSEISGHRLIILGSAPNASAMNSAPSCLLRPRFVEQPCESRMTYPVAATVPAAVNHELAKFAHNQTDVYFVDPADSICPGGECKAIADGKVLFSDGEHLSKDGARAVAPLIQSALDSGNDR
ncbi:hypothetical protein BIZ92_20580 [Achromobacter xylosoxidans]|uniref:Acyltransferase n=3 Tax=Achromobacter TaxID=222 RepID=A0A1R1JX71_ALCXX|nr:hypothetical protein BIZ92_20580 [Achromobacter xylosoxidans]